MNIDEAKTLAECRQTVQQMIDRDINTVTNVPTSQNVPISQNSQQIGQRLIDSSTNVFKTMLSQCAMGLGNNLPFRDSVSLNPAFFSQLVVTSHLASQAAKLKPW